jgi:L-threonylcarbamoyladenylate synthase
MSSRIIKFNLNNRRELGRAVAEAAIVLKSGGVVVHPTDTCYGIAADITNQKALEKVYQLKRRNRQKPLKIIVKNLKEFRKYGQYYPAIRHLIKKYEPHQICFVVPRTKAVPLFLNPQDSTIGIQVPRCSICQQLLRKTGVPLVATSANISNEKECYNLLELSEQFNKTYPGQPPFLILYGGQLPRKKPSSVVKVMNNKEIEILRLGDAGQIKI